MLVKRLWLRRSLLRTRGGISLDWFQLGWGLLTSPHTRRYFHHRHHLGVREGLFSAHAEVFPNLNPNPPRRMTLLRTRGGISKLQRVLGDGMDSSPHTRRYFRASAVGCSLELLFSAHAEVFPHHPALFRS